MNFSNLSSEQRIRILLQLIGGPQYSEQMKRAALQTGSLAKQTQIAGDRALVASRKTFLWNQMLYTMRRYAFFATLGVTALAAEVLRMGFVYDSTMQKARTTLRPFFGSNGELQKNLNQLFALAAQTPFMFQDITKSFATLYQGFKPLGISAKETRNTILGLSNALVVAQRFTPAAINKATLALQHMAFQGRLTGRMVNQLGQDGIPIFEILNEKLHLSGLNLTNIARLGIPAQTVLKAINSFLLNDPHYRNQAYRSQTATLTGAFSTFKDFLSQAAGGSSGGIFSGLHKFFLGIDNALRPAVKRGKPITLTQLIGGIDSTLTPKTHAIIMLFQFLTGAINGFTFAVKATILVVTTLLRPLDFLINLFGGGNRGGTTKILGYIVGMLLFVAVVRKGIAAVKLLTGALRIEMATEVASIIVRKKTALWLLITNLGYRGAAGWIFQAALMNLFEAKTAVIAGLAMLRMKAAAITLAISMAGLTLATLAWVVALTAGLALIALIIIDRKKLFGGSQYTPGNPRGDITKHPSVIKHPSWWTQNFAWLSKVSDPIAQFDTGGIVQGRRGSPQMIMAHAGETILPTHRTGMGNLFGGTIEPADVNMDGKKVAEIVFKYKAKSDADH